MSAIAYAEMNKLASEVANDLCTNQRYVDAVNSAAKFAVKQGVKLQTGNPILSHAAGLATEKFIESNETIIPKVVGAIGTGVLLSAGSVVFAVGVVVAVPVIIVKGIFDKIFGD